MSPRTIRRGGACWHDRVRGQCWLCRLGIRGDDYWLLMRECRRRLRGRK